MKYITLNVDDLGYSPAVNRAVLQLAAKRRIHSASLMSLGTLPAEQAQQLQHEGIALGLHLDFSGLADCGGLRRIIRRSWLRAWDAVQLADHIRRQLDCFEQLTAAVPAFIDGHQHVHQFPQIRETLLHELQQRYPQPIPWRSTRPFFPDGKSRLIYALGGRATVRLLARHGIAHNRSFGGAYGFAGDERALARRWQRWLRAAPPYGGLLMCHPAVGEDMPRDGIEKARLREYQWLAGEAFAQLWQAYDCRAQNWEQLTAAAPPAANTV